MDPVVDIVIVSFLSEAAIGDCLQAALSAEGVGKVIVVDNNSTDRTVSICEELGVHLIKNEENIGFSRANNKGLALVTAELVLFLNPDTILPKGGLVALAQELATNPTTGIASLPLVYPDGKPQQSAYAFPTPMSIFWQNLGLLTVLKKLGYQNTVVPGVVDWALGACLCVRTKEFQNLGKWNETFFLYQEDTDICKTYRSKGLMTRVLAGPAVIHLGREKGRDYGKVSVLFNQAILTYFDLHFGGVGRAWARIVFCLGHGVRALVFRILGKRDRAVFEGKNFLFFLKAW